MKALKVLLLALLALPLLVACGKDPPASDTAQTQAQPETLLGKIVADKTAEIRQSLYSSALLIGGGEGMRFDIKQLDAVDVLGSQNTIANLPVLAIRANGEVIINQQPITLSAEQQALTARYHQQARQIADVGIGMAIAGADLGGSALTQVATGFLNGKSSQQIEAEFAAQAEKIKTQARDMCQQIDGMMGIQNQLAQTLPEFAPYAVIERDAIDKCLKELEESIAIDSTTAAP